MPLRTRRPSRISELIGFYRGLSPRARRATWALLAFEAILVAAAEEVPRVSKDTVGLIIVVALVSAAAFSTAWVFRDARARGIPRVRG